MSWIRFEEKASNTKTKRWTVLPHQEIYPLGEIKWYGPWRKYCFFPNSARMVILEEHCLRDIALFCEERTKEHKALR